MTQTVLNEPVELPADTYVKISEIECMFIAQSNFVEVLGTDGVIPTKADVGVRFDRGAGMRKSDNFLASFVGAGAAPDGLYAISRGEKGSIFVSREAV